MKPTPKDNKGWHSRGYLPHRDESHLLQSVTFRLADSMPAERLNEWRDWLRPDGQPRNNDPELRRKIDQYLDLGYGACYLRQPEVGLLVENALRFFDEDRYYLLAWVVMPNHVHVVFEMREGHPLDAVVHSWKSFTANEANKVLGRSGDFWFPEYWDRYIRDLKHLNNVMDYILENPLKANLVSDPTAWPWTSARYLRRETRIQTDRHGCF